ncbi:MAG: beta-ribofuranosylaminobenzene 5-phosphate synthase [Solirubrobacteraceae bacterium]|jgi:beta-ribofuranosylaminobenzene 5'-phosphate synthase|nr:beta-ribofuranosylaminobenzene 5-phosphate synthase [Solirubrobacteraceae bacterium]
MTNKTVTVTGGARFHITLIDMHGTVSNRVDGGVGFMLEDPAVRVAATAAPTRDVQWSSLVATSQIAAFEPQVHEVLDRVRDVTDTGDWAVRIDTCPMPHTGLGAKTQTLLAVATAATAVYDKHLDLESLGRVTARGGTSGIGMYGFERGGLIVDGGHSFADKNQTDAGYRPSAFSTTMRIPPLLSRMRFPAWPILLLTPHGREIHGPLEASLFAEVCPVPLDDVRSLTHLLLMRLLPAVAECNLSAFGRSLWDVQDHCWKAFEIDAQVVGIGRILRRLRSELGVAGAGMSSWGTSIACFDPRLSDSRCSDLLQEVQNVMDDETDGGDLILTRARNSAAAVSVG